jgi:hypothetical protein
MSDPPYPPDEQPTSRLPPQQQAPPAAWPQQQYQQPPPPPPPRRGRDPLPYALGALVIALAFAAGAGGWIAGKRDGTDLDAAREKGKQDAARIAVVHRDPKDEQRAFRQGRRAGYKDAYRRAYDNAKNRALAGAPRNCGDLPGSGAPFVGKVRAEGVACGEALAFAKSAVTCQDLDGGTCQGYSCSTVDVGYESTEATCTSGDRRIRFLTGS